MLNLGFFPKNLFDSACYDFVRKKSLQSANRTTLSLSMQIHVVNFERLQFIYLLLSINRMHIVSCICYMENKKRIGNVDF